MKKVLIVALALLCIPISGAACANTVLNAKTAVTASQSVSYDEWFDAARKRTVPVKIYMPTTGKPPYPVVIFSHGLGGSREAAPYLGEHLSAHGYLCIHVQHPGSDDAVWKSSLGGGREAIQSKLKLAANGENLLARVQDIKFVLDEMERRNNATGPLSGKLDLSRIALAGHSFGAGTTMAIAGENYSPGGRTVSLPDPRVKAAIYMSAPVDLNGRTPQEVFGNIRIPGLLMTGTQDSSPIGRTEAKDRVIPFEGIQAGDQYLVNFIGGDHMIFSGRERAQVNGSSDEQFHKMIDELATAFLDAYLCGNQSAKQWLHNDARAYLGSAAEFKSK